MHVISGKLRKEPFVKPGCGQDGQSTMYAIELSEVIKEWQSDDKAYTNYSALFFAKTPAANEFYQKAFAKDSFVVVSCEKLKTDIQQGNDGRTFVKMQMDNARLQGAEFQDPKGNWGQPNNQQQPQQQQGYGNQPQAQAGQQYSAQPQQQQMQQPQQQMQGQPQQGQQQNNIDDNIPF